VNGEGKLFCSDVADQMARVLSIKSQKIRFCFGVDSPVLFRGGGDVPQSFLVSSEGSGRGTPKDEAPGMPFKSSRLSEKSAGRDMAFAKPALPYYSTRTIRANKESRKPKGRRRTKTAILKT